MKNKRRDVQLGGLPKLLVRVFILIAFGAVIPLGFWWLDEKGKDVGKNIHELEQKYASLENTYRHEDARWKEKLTTENLDRAIELHGLGMAYPEARQIVRVNADGIPLPRQIALAYLQKVSRPEPFTGNR